ncbi:LacI family DNA-binding transcriptional regulator [Tichowtungia aerotolerans]|uniref:Substrate-binding domain-containing protein n=1 Tax=Tichowtungia aerotolerans TaxID=2697043 RepID=A0A6P1M2S6_9BACT|nr:LacI family DNA-binding transcriptional regulator [Tichowtungia aerotolerans]QHI69139.1 substrate-binding domain-containing protein [Tichowtungia aerotolerans]
MTEKTNKKRVTLNMIAEHCNVNKGTVSRVLNGKFKNFQVSPEKIQEIQTAAKTMGYQPNRMARVIRCNRTYLIGVSFMKLDYIDRADRFNEIGQFVQAMESHPLFKKYDLVFHIRHENKSEPLTDMDFKSDLLEGMIYLLPTNNHKEFLDIASPDFPVVLVGSLPGSSKKLPCVDINNRKAARKAVNYLLETGKKNIITLVPENSKHVQCFKDRTRGYKDALISAKIPQTKQKIYTIPCDPNSVRDLLSNLKDLKKIDAIFCQIDELAAHCITTLRNLNFKVPEDIAVIGFDDSMICQMTTPTISSIKRPVEEQAYQAIDTLLNILEKNRDYTPGFTEIETELIKRESTEGRR